MEQNNKETEEWYFEIGKLWKVSQYFFVAILTTVQNTLLHRLQLADKRPYGTATFILLASSKEHAVLTTPAEAATNLSNP